MNTSRCSGFKERDDEYRSHNSHAYGKRTRNFDLEVEDRGNHLYKDSESNRKDALTDFRAGIPEDEAYHQSSRCHDKLAVSPDSHRKGCDKRAYSSGQESRHSHSRSYRKDRRSPDKRMSKDVYAYEWERVKDSLHSHGSSSHYRQSTSGEAERLESYNRPNENRSSRFDQDLKGQGERPGCSISRTSSVRSNSRRSSSALSSPHPHKRRRQRSRSRSVSRESKSRRHKRLPEESRRSVLTGKKIKLKVKRSRGDEEREANRQELLQFLNSAYE